MLKELSAKDPSITRKAHEERLTRCSRGCRGIRGVANNGRLGLRWCRGSGRRLGWRGRRSAIWGRRLGRRRIRAEGDLTGGSHSKARRVGKEKLRAKEKREN
ncbi:unnamed protein product [Linum trigynum]|uniref:Uncharacterized protein n=1 Tax=Linum trigynum TaxID=586398 RepID=A0AAV2DE48_9ROSI